MKYDNRKKADKLTRSCAAEYLTYVAAAEQNGWYILLKGRYAISKDMVYLPLNYLWTDVDTFKKSKINFNIRKNFCKKTDVYIV